MIDELLQKTGLKYEDLNPIERDTLNTWLTNLSTNTITLEQIRNYIAQMKESLEVELSGYTEPKTIWDFLFSKRKDIYRKARLKNYLLLLAFLSGPEKAKKVLEASLKNIKPKSA